MIDQDSNPPARNHASVRAEGVSDHRASHTLHTRRTVSPLTPPLHLARSFGQCALPVVSTIPAPETTRCAGLLACVRERPHIHAQQPSFPAASSRVQSTAGNAGRVSRFSIQWGWMADMGPRDHPPSLTCSVASRKDGAGPYIGVQFTLRLYISLHFTLDINTSLPPSLWD